MERCPVPWSETPPPSSIPTPSQLHHPPPSDEQQQHNHMDQVTSDTEGPTSNPASRRGSLQPASRTPTPTSSVPPDAIQLAYSSAVENDPVGGMTVIRGMKSLSPDESGHSPVGGEQLVYQTLGDSNGFMGQYAAASGVGYSTGGFSPAPVDPPSPYDKYSYVKVSAYAQGDVHMVQGYDPEGSRPLSPSNVVYTTYQYPSQEASNAHHPMWGPLGNAGSSPYLTGLGSPIMESGDPNGRGGQGYAPYMGNSTYLLASGNDTGWSTLPPMSSSSYMQEGRRTQYIDPPPEYSRIPEPPQHQCAMCGTTDSTPWRRDSAGQFVCNTCGIYKNGVGSRASAIRPPRRLTTSRRVGMTCSNCSTTDTTLWRRNTQGEPVCNACGLYYKLHQVNRPISMRKDSIQTRKRKPKSTGSSKTKSSNSSSSNGRNGSSSKSPLSQQQPSSSSAVYHHQMAEGGGRMSPLLPSSAALSQQLPHFAPLDPHSPPERIVLENGLMMETSSGPSSVISMAPNHKQL